MVNVFCSFFLKMNSNSYIGIIINIRYWLNTDIIAWFKRLFGFTGSAYVKFGYSPRMLDNDEGSNKCRNCGHELDDDANFYTFVELKGYDFA